MESERLKRAKLDDYDPTPYLKTIGEGSGKRSSSLFAKDVFFKKQGEMSKSGLNHLLSVTAIVDATSRVRRQREASEREA